MTDIPSKFDPASVEDKWYSYWMENRFFHSEPDDRDLYSIVIPPPNVTGVLHMGHMLNNTIQDVLVRRARMLGKNVCWVPGTDHASIATEAKVVAKLKSEGINKNDISRDTFLKHAWEWKEKHGGIILEQLKKLGASCDWDRTKFTMDEDLSESVIDVFIDLHEKGLIYRGVRMVNWDPQAKTAVSDEEVIYKEEKSKLYYVRYQIFESDDYVTIATTRPETILGDTAVCVHPEDERYQHLNGKKVIIPLVNRVVPIIYDDYVDKEFGTGALKITPAHDINDYEIGQKHKLESIDIFNDDGTLSENALLFVGEDRFEVRRKICDELEKSGNLVKVEDYLNKVGFSERTDSVIEPKLSMQWFLQMAKLAKPALEHVMNDDIKIYPPKFKNTYKHWMENVKDWCISRQLWWGHRIPAYYINGTNQFVIAKNIDEALEKAKTLTNNSGLSVNDLQQEEDVLDTWFSSWLWPISVFDGIRHPENADIKYYYPTNDLVTAPEILFFWVARMIIAGYEYLNKKPFENVYLTGIVRDSQHRKMSKSLGNSPDPIKLMKKYGADGVRVGMLLCSPAGNDLLFEENLPEQGRNFTNKIWNAFRLVKTWKVEEIKQPEHSKNAIDWFDNKLKEGIDTVDDHFKKFRLSDALMTLYKLFWDDFSSWYLEIIKPVYQHPIDKATYTSTIEFFEKMIQLLHPFVPFITEEIWHFIKQRDEKDSIMMSIQPGVSEYNKRIVKDFENIKQVVSSIRNLRTEKNIAQKDALQLAVHPNGKYFGNYDEVIKKLANISEIEQVQEKIDEAASFRINTIEYYVPLGDKIDKEEERKKMEDELKYAQGFLKGVLKKLSNDKFVNNAPANVVEMERKKKEDAETKIKVLEDRIKNLN